MKLFHKLFLCFVVIFGISFQIAGFLMIHFAYENAIEQEKKFAFQEFQYNKYILQSMMYSQPGLYEEKADNYSSFKNSFTVAVALYREDKTCIFTSLEVKPAFAHLGDEKKDGINFQMIQSDQKKYICVYGAVIQSGYTVYLVTETDISQVAKTQEEMVAYFQKIYLIILGIGFPIIFLLSSLITRSIKRVSKAAKRIAEGSYSERIGEEGRDEIGELAVNFNQMAEKVEEKVAQLSDIVRQKEDFAANFAHELKTPMTSVIGYADMLYQRDLSREQVKSAAEYILNEGMRLEALSLKLMDLFVLDKQDFTMEKISVPEIIAGILQGTEHLQKKNNIMLHSSIKPGIIEADYDLLKTMLLNLVDNAIKADCKDIWVYGSQQGAQYQIEVRDNGKGIPKEEVGRITEAFYMVDKSRARKQHGAGLGLALVAKIMEVHSGELMIESDGEHGTTVRLAFLRWEGEEYE